MLLQKPVKPKYKDMLPCPNDLRNKIILKVYYSIHLKNYYNFLKPVKFILTNKKSQTL